MSDQLLDFVLSVAGGALGAVFTYWIWLRQQIHEIRRDYDAGVHTARMTAYAGLWREFEPLAVYAPTENVTYERIGRLGVALRTWYFDQGGLLLTERSRDGYFLVQDAIDRIAERASEPPESTGTEPPRFRAPVRPRTTHWTRARLDQARVRVGLPALYGAEAMPESAAAWRGAVSAIIDGWDVGREPADDFVLLQYLASSLRTLLARDIRARDPSLLDNGRVSRVARFRSRSSRPGPELP